METVRKRTKDKLRSKHQNDILENLPDVPSEPVMLQLGENETEKCEEPLLSTNDSPEDVATDISAPLNEDCILPCSTMASGEQLELQNSLVAGADSENDRTPCQKYELFASDSFVNVVCDLEPSAPKASVTAIDEYGGGMSPRLDIRQEISTRQTLKRVYPELDLEDLNVQPMSQLEMRQLNQSALLQRKGAMEDEFLQVYSENNFVDHELYKLITGYQSERRGMSKLLYEQKELTNKADEFSTMIWSLGRGQVSSYSRCGDNRQIEKSHEYQVATWEHHRAAKLSDTLRELLNLCKDKFAISNHSCQVLKTQVDVFLNNILFPFRSIPKSAPVPTIGKHEWGREQGDAKESLRIVISVLFSFARRTYDDDEFVKQVRFWVKLCTSVLLRLAALEDHAFILFHVLRCPPGIHKWAVDLVQIPPVQCWENQNWLQYSFQPSIVFEHSLCVLWLVCHPIKQRDSFLGTLRAMAEATSSDSWCLVDSEGEDYPNNEGVFLDLNECDIVALLNQIPFSEIFKYMMLVDNVYNAGRASEDQMIKLIAFARQLVKILHQGLITYNQPRYRNLTKRISRLIRHCVEYLSDHWEALLSLREYKISGMVRIQVEYDQLLVQAVNSIFYSESLGAWQFMAVLPYKNVSNGIMWQLLWLLHNSYKEDLQLVDMSAHEICKRLQAEKKLEERCDQMDQDEVFYLLTSLTNMAISRGENGRAFVHVVAVEVFEIAYINLNLREIHSKVGRELLSRLVNQHPFVVSVLLDQAHHNMDIVGHMASYLFSELDLGHWIPDDEDLDILSEFITGFELSSPRNSLARLILQNINYGHAPKSDQILLNEQHHQKVAMIILEAYKNHYLPFDKTGYAYKQFKYISDYALGVKQSATPDGFIQYLWDLIRRLRLHLFDYPHPAQRKLIMDDEPPLGIAFSLENTDWMGPLKKGVEDGMPPAMYLALMMSTVGHYREDIAERGLPLIAELVAKEQFTAAVEATQRVTTVFVCQPHQLVNNTKFLSALEGIIQADSTYATVLKNLVATTVPGDILSHLIRAIIEQIKRVKLWGLQKKCILMWMELLLNLPEISLKKGQKCKSRDSILFLLDTIIQIAYHEDDCIEEVITFLHKTMSDICPSNASSGSMVRSIMSYVLGFGSSWPIIVPLPSAKYFPWFALVGLIAEGRLEMNKEPWNDIVKQIAVNNKSRDVAMKVSSQNFKMPSQEFMLIYRWAQQAIDTDMDHPAVPLIWQQFFLIYFQRSETLGSAGYKMFEGETNFSLFKQLKGRLTEITDHFQRKQSNLAKVLLEEPLSDPTRDSKREKMTQMQEAKLMLSQLHKFYRSLCLWIEEPRLHEANVTLLSLPQQYNPDLLKSIFSGRNELWNNLVQRELIGENLKKRFDRPDSMNSKMILALNQSKEEQPVEEKILRRLQCYDDKRLPPAMPHIREIMPQISEEALLSGKGLLQTAKGEMRIIVVHARSFNAQTVHLSNLDEKYLELVRKLYTNQVREVEQYIPCGLAIKCKQQAKLVFNFSEAQMNKIVDKEVTENRNDWAAILGDVKGTPAPTIINAYAFIECCITKLINCITLRPHLSPELRTTASRLFSDLISLMDKECLAHSPTRQFLIQCVDVLGMSVVAADPNQAEVLLDLIIRNPHLVSFLSPCFAPAVCEPSRYSEMYNALCYSLSPALYETVFLLLTKFDVGGYLRAKPTSALDRQNMIGTLNVALQSIGRKDDAQLRKIAQLYLNHMQSLLVANDCEHYFEILNMLLNGVKQNNLSTETFNSFFEALGYKLISTGQLPNHIGAPGSSRVMDTLKMVAEFFKTFRTMEPSARNNGLYCLCENYIQQVSNLNTLTGYLFSHYKSQEMSYSLPSAADIDMTLEAIFELYEPWLAVMKEGKNLNLPWLPGESLKSQVMLDSYFKVLGIIQNVIYRFHGCVFNFIWQRYFTSYVWNNTSAYICIQYYETMLTLPWEQFVPSVSDMRLMSKVMESKYAEHMPLLTKVFFRVNWRYLLMELCPKWEADAKEEVYSRFAELLIKIGWDQQIAKSATTTDFYKCIEDVDWSCIPNRLVTDLLIVFSLSCDPLCVLLPDDTSQDDALLDFVSRLSCMDQINANHSTLEKQASFFSMTARLLLKCAETPGSRDLVKNRQCVSHFIPKYLDILSKLIDTKQSSFNDQSTLHIQQILHVLSIIEDKEWLKVLTEGLVHWIEDNPGSSLILPCLSVATSGIINQHAVPLIVEACISAYTRSEIEMFASDGGWSTILSYIRFPSTNVDELLKAAVENSAYLTLYSYVLYKLPQCGTLDNELSLLSRMVDWLIESVPSSHDAEPKILLLWEKVLLLSLRQLECGGDIRVIFRHLLRLTDDLAQMGEDKIAGGILGVIGLGRTSRFSATFRFNCRVMAALLSAHFTEDGLVLLNKSASGQHKIHPIAIQTANKLKSTMGNKIYSSIATEVDAAIQLVTSTDLRESQNSVKSMVNFFYPTVSYLQVLFFGVL